MERPRGKRHQGKGRNEGEKVSAPKVQGVAPAEEEGMKTSFVCRTGSPKRQSIENKAFAVAGISTDLEDNVCREGFGEYGLPQC